MRESSILACPNEETKLHSVCVNTETIRPSLEIKVMAPYTTLQEEGELMIISLTNR